MKRATMEHGAERPSPLFDSRECVPATAAATQRGWTSRSAPDDTVDRMIDHSRIDPL
ncbi:MAG TPA: hypothetical protein VFH95_10705 [Candidatus Kapabacteria bacterium]|nr:hypothetical protein [Candidatus Kapabacteria bacterium]